MRINLIIVCQWTTGTETDMDITIEEAIVLENLRKHRIDHLYTMDEWEAFEKLTRLDKDLIKEAIVGLGKKGILQPTFTLKIKNRPAPYPQAIKLTVIKNGGTYRKRFPQWLRKELYKRADYRCQIQGCVFCNNRNLSGVKWGLSIDHLVPVDYGKFHDAAIEHSAQNLRVVCFRWNCWARNKPLREKFGYAPIPPQLITDEEFQALLAKHKTKVNAEGSTLSMK